MAWFGGYTLETYNRIPGDYEDVTVTAAVTELSASKINPVSGPYARMPARAAMLSSENADLRFRIDGGQPSISEGHYLVNGDTLVLSGTQALEQFQAVAIGNDSATLRVTYFY